MFKLIRRLLGNEEEEKEVTSLYAIKGIGEVTAAELKDFGITDAETLVEEFGTGMVKDVKRLAQILSRTGEKRAQNIIENAIYVVEGETNE